MERSHQLWEFRERRMARPFMDGSDLSSPQPMFRSLMSLSQLLQLCLANYSTPLLAALFGWLGGSFFAVIRGHMVSW
jgi:hypothetical protein